MVHRTEVARAIVMIARRRAKVDDRHRDLLSDSEDSDPREVLDYLRKFSGSDSLLGPAGRGERRADP
jgi:hypothetical protein